MTDESAPDAWAEWMPARRGHFLVESGHHGELWMDLERLCLDPLRARRLAKGLAERLAAHPVEAVCGPLVEGAFVALLVAEELGLPFTYAERLPSPGAGGLFPVRYRVPEPLRSAVEGRRIAVVNDVVSAGSAVRGTLADLRDKGARAVAIGTLAVLGPGAAALAREQGLALETLFGLEGSLWTPAECPLCARGLPIEEKGLS